MDNLESFFDLPGVHLKKFLLLVMAAILDGKGGGG
jgi:hypothetical protein